MSMSKVVNSVALYSAKVAPPAGITSQTTSHKHEFRSETNRHRRRLGVLLTNVHPLRIVGPMRLNERDEVLESDVIMTFKYILSEFEQTPSLNSIDHFNFKRIFESWSMDYRDYVRKSAARWLVSDEVDADLSQHFVQHAEEMSVKDFFLFEDGNLNGSVVNAVRDCIIEESKHYLVDAIPANNQSASNEGHPLSRGASFDSGMNSGVLPKQKKDEEWADEVEADDLYWNGAFELESILKGRQLPPEVQSLLTLRAKSMLEVAPLIRAYMLSGSLDDARDRLNLFLRIYLNDMRAIMTSSIRAGMVEARTQTSAKRRGEANARTQVVARVERQQCYAYAMRKTNVLRSNFNQLIDELSKDCKVCKMLSLLIGSGTILWAAPKNVSPIQGRISIIENVLPVMQYWYDVNRIPKRDINVYSVEGGRLVMENTPEVVYLNSITDRMIRSLVAQQNAAVQGQLLSTHSNCLYVEFTPENLDNLIHHIYREAFYYAMRGVGAVKVVKYDSSAPTTLRTIYLPRTSANYLIANGAFFVKEMYPKKKLRSGIEPVVIKPTDVVHDNNDLLEQVVTLFNEDHSDVFGMSGLKWYISQSDMSIFLRNELSDKELSKIYKNFMRNGGVLLQAIQEIFGNNLKASNSMKKFESTLYILLKHPEFMAYAPPLKVEIDATCNNRSIVGKVNDVVIPVKSFTNVRDDLEHCSFDTL